MRKILTFVFLLFYFTAFAQREVIEYLNNDKIVKADSLGYHYNYDLVRIYKVDNKNRVIGDVVEFNQGNIPARRYHFKNGIFGKIDGYLIEYWCYPCDTGKITHYINGKRDGESISYFYFNDARKEKYKTNRIVTSKAFYKKGKLIDSISFLNGDTAEIIVWNYGLFKREMHSHNLKNNCKHIEISIGHKTHIFDSCGFQIKKYTTKNGLLSGIYFEIGVYTKDTFYWHYKKGELHGVSYGYNSPGYSWRKFNRGIIRDYTNTDASKNIIFMNKMVGKYGIKKKYFKKGRVLFSSSIQLIRHKKLYLKSDTLFYRNGKIHTICKSFIDKNLHEEAVKIGSRSGQFHRFNYSIFDSIGKLAVFFDTINSAKVYLEKDVNVYPYYGLESYEGKKITAPDYKGIWQFGAKYFWVWDGTYYGVIDQNGKEVHPVDIRYYNLLLVNLPASMYAQFDSSIYEAPDSLVFDEVGGSECFKLFKAIPKVLIDTNLHASYFPYSIYVYQQSFCYNFIKDSTGGVIDYQGNILFEDKNLGEVFPLGEGYFGLKYRDYTMGLAHFTKGIIKKGIKSQNPNNSLNSAKKDGKLIFNFSNSNIDLWYDEDGNRVDYKK